MSIESSLQRLEAIARRRRKIPQHMLGYQARAIMPARVKQYDLPGLTSRTGLRTLLA
jgi:hypothetical protein